MKPVIIIAIAFVLLIPLSVFAQTGSRDIMEEYCVTNWNRDPVQCADFVPEDYDENKAYYSAQEAEKARADAEKINKDVRESERICPDGSHVTADNQGKSICVDSSGRFVGYPNTNDIELGGDTGTIVGVVVVIIIIVAIIAKVSQYSSKSYKDTPRRNFSSDVEEQTLQNQKNKCNDCQTPIGVVKGRTVYFDYDHIDGKHDNNSPDNCQALCKNCHAKKTERERGMDRS
jgi:hypothetical protein